MSKWIITKSAALVNSFFNIFFVIFEKYFPLDFGYLWRFLFHVYRFYTSLGKMLK